jgi:hypothetical protein
MIQGLGVIHVRQNEGDDIQRQNRQTVTDFFLLFEHSGPAPSFSTPSFQESAKSNLFKREG